MADVYGPRKLMVVPSLRRAACSRLSLRRSASTPSREPRQPRDQT